MTPTNEAGHGLPKLPQTEEFALRAMATNYGEGHRWDSLDRDVCRRAADEIKILRERIVALSRGVPADMVLVPREPTEAMLDAMHESIRIRCNPNKRTADIQNDTHVWAAMLAAAPAAAGAQGEVAHVTIDFPQVGTAGPFKVINGRMTLPDVTMNDLIHHARTGYVQALQPAAADGGVRERARELLADAQQMADGHGVNARLILDEGMSLRCNVACDVALRAVSAALSSHRQAGDESWNVLQIGNRGAAYDPANTKRAYTYQHQPGNLDAHRLGAALASAADATYGDNIDRGLSLLKALEYVGFGVFQIGPTTTGGKDG